MILLLRSKFIGCLDNLYPRLTACLNKGDLELTKFASCYPYDLIVSNTSTPSQAGMGTPKLVTESVGQAFLVEAL